MTNEPTTVAINRPLVGMISLVCLGLWIFLYIRYPNAEGDLRMWQGGFMRSGLLMGAFWIALPSKNRQAAWATVRPWTLVGVILAVITFARFPRAGGGLLVAAALLGFFLRPRRGARDHRPDRDWKSS